MFNLKYLMLDTNVYFRRSSLKLLFKNLTILEELHLECQGVTDDCGDDDTDEYYINDDDCTVANLKYLKRVSLAEMSKCPEVGLRYLSQISILENIMYRNSCEAVCILICSLVNF